MKTLGLIGGVGPESTIEYYRMIVAAYRERDPHHAYPAIVINSVNLQQYIEWLNANELDKFTAELVREIERLARAGADFAALASNTPHIVFDELQRQSSLPLISIVEAACERAQQLRLKRVGLLGTRFTMQGRFYPDVFSNAAIKLVTPNEAEQTYIHDKYMGELLNNVFSPETREEMLRIVDNMKAREGIEGVILGGTEIPLLLRAELFLEGIRDGIHFLDTTRIHVERLVRELLS